MAATALPVSSRPRPSVACVGEAMVVLSPEGGGSLETVELLRRSVGGAEANVARMLAALDVPVAFVSRIGDDPFGRLVRAELRAGGVDDRAVEVDPERSTGMYVKAPGPGGSSMYYYRSASAATAMAARFFASAIVDSSLRDARVIHTSGITAGILEDPDDLLAALRRSRAAGTLVSVDLNWRPALWRGRDPAALRDLLTVADLVLVGADEARSALGTDDPDELRALVAPHATIVIKSEAHVATGIVPGADPVVVPALRVDVSEPVGAGDAFAGGYLAGLLGGLPLEQRLRLGHLCAAMVLVSADDHAPPPPSDVREWLLTCPADEWATLRVGPGGLTGPALERQRSAAPRGMARP